MKIYIVWHAGRAAHIVKGRVAARKLGPSFTPYASQLAAEEFSAWWNHDQQARDAAIDAALQARIAAKWPSTRT